MCEANRTLNLRLSWVPVKGFTVSHHDKEAILFIFDPFYGNLNKNPLTRTLRVQVVLI